MTKYLMNVWILYTKESEFKKVNKYDLRYCIPNSHDCIGITAKKLRRMSAIQQNQSPWYCWIEIVEKVI